MISNSEAKLLETAHNKVEKDGSVKVVRTYADVVQNRAQNEDMVERLEVSEDQIEKFFKLNPLARLVSGGISEINPLDKELNELPPVNSLYKNN